ncbi:hypothetical protein [Rhodospirillum centenum]|uniref:Uncharacterized protein n=1 Tax=Rhodospirillum centenum (strain ATCC 51521 / SW) TaxID=414684 RepID=B6IQF8_RHOCS|nr:hypothetical protein [Rhodospirillum centenum]ACI97694.1 hypothetical protein RC1_0245 [Rhodospirillum centenum SW]
MLMDGRTPVLPLTGFALLAQAMGLAAAGRGETALDNPFVEEPGASAAWIDGWMRGQTGRSAPLPGRA